MPTHDLSINPSLHSISLAILALIVANGAVATPVAAHHRVREIVAVLDLSWVHSEIAPYYARIGRPLD